MDSTDIQLLRDYHLKGDDSAFTELVDRHTGWIFAAARRRLQDDHLADDATQAVFVVLASRAAELAESGRQSLAAWLFHVLHFACSRVRRSQGRRMHHEGIAQAVRRSDPDDFAADNALLLLMEDSIAQVPAGERELIVRRFYRRESFAQIGQVLGISAEAARKRVTRALVEIKTLMVRDGVDAIPDAFLERLDHSASGSRTQKAAVDRNRIDTIAKGTMTMVEQAKACDYPVVSAEFYVKDVEANLDFFEKLGFRRRYVEAVDPMGRVPRASLVSGVGRIWLRRADESEGTRPSPGVILYFWIDGAAEGLLAHRKRISDEGITVSPFTDDITLRSFTVKAPDGYEIGFFAQYR